MLGRRQRAGRHDFHPLFQHSCTSPLTYMSPKARPAADVHVWTRPGGGGCAAAGPKALLQGRSLEIHLWMCRIPALMFLSFTLGCLCYDNLTNN